MKYFIVIITLIIAALCSNAYFYEKDRNGYAFTEDYLKEESYFEINALNQYSGDEYGSDFYEQDAANLFLYTDIADNI